MFVTYIPIIRHLNRIVTDLHKRDDRVAMGKEAITVVIGTNAGNVIAGKLSTLACPII